MKESPRTTPCSSLLSKTSATTLNRDAFQKSERTGKANLSPQSNQLSSPGASTKEVLCISVLVGPHSSLHFTYGLIRRKPRTRVVMSKRRYSELEKPQALWISMDTLPSMACALERIKSGSVRCCCFGCPATRNWPG